MLLYPKLSQLVLKQNKTHKQQTLCGYGACSVSGCYCQAYEGNANTCENCGHNYQRHW
ncbi:hypothetical protein [Brunnivagina elsteri]|uniref:hypothetical protein n=1 Tax=Brunnivagina elsteri TaxID=1247191 RepID=UPI0013042125|nr:hypothetical protein [Calothrix elsteri]